MQDSLPAGGLRLYREGVEPSGSLRKVSGYIAFLLSRIYPVARIVFANMPIFALTVIPSALEKDRWVPLRLERRAKVHFLRRRTPMGRR
jgi:hypothetical protein